MHIPYKYYKSIDSLIEIGKNNKTKGEIKVIKG